MCLGVILQGGDDYYDIDLEIVDYIYKANIPCLGICLGMQTMGIYMNGILEMIPTMHSHNNKNKKYSHSVKIVSSSKLYHILGEEIIKVNSRHNYILTKTDLSIVGYSDDYFIEAIEDTNKLFFIGVEWHPESMVKYDSISNKLFDYFMDMCRGIK